MSSEGDQQEVPLLHLNSSVNHTAERLQRDSDSPPNGAGGLLLPEGHLLLSNPRYR